MHLIVDPLYKMIVTLNLQIGLLSHLVVDLHALILLRQVRHGYCVDKEYFYPARCNFTPLFFAFYFVFTWTCSKQFVKNNNIQGNLIRDYVLFLGI